MRQYSPLIVLAIHFFPIQLNSSTEAAAGLVVVAIAAGVIGEVFVVKVDVHTIVTALQARRKHPHSDSEIKRSSLNPHQRLGKEDPPILGR